MRFGLRRDEVMGEWRKLHKNVVWLFEHLLLLVAFVGYVCFVWEQHIVSNGVVGICYSQDGFHHIGHIRHHWTFPFEGIDLSGGLLCI
jgi:hypothetical protein